MSTPKDKVGRRLAPGALAPDADDVQGAGGPVSPSAPVSLLPWWRRLCTKLRGSSLMPTTPKFPTAEQVLGELRDECRLREAAEHRANRLAHMLARARIRIEFLERELARRP